MTDAALETLAHRLGILPEYRDVSGEMRPLSPETQEALLRAMGIDPARAAETLDALDAEDAARTVPLWQVVETDAPLRLDAIGGEVEWRLELEDGTLREGRGPEIGALPLGIHRLWVSDQYGWLLSAPARLPEPERGWGVTLPLYGLRTAEEGGVGTYADLRHAVASLGAAGADFVGLNPIHAGFPTDPGGFSPYAPSSRRRFSTLHIDAAANAEAGELIDYAHAIPAQLSALEHAFANRDPAPAFDEWREAEGTPLRRFALHQALAEVHGPHWPDWPAPFRDPSHPDVSAFAQAHSDRVTFHAWLQWTAEQQLSQVRDAAAQQGMTFGLYLDLAVGTHPGGAETWAERDLFAHGVSLGAPPDAFSPGGQAWGLAPLQPRALAEQGFRPLAEILRAQLKFARLLRIDHILGFERTFWVPDGDVPGGYVAMPKEALLAVARIEATRVGAAIIGEDLGNIPEGLHRDLEGAGIFGCRVAMFEQEWDAPQPTFKPADHYDAHVLTSFSTHDLPTWKGWRAERDIDWRQDIGTITSESADEMRARRREEVAALDHLTGDGEDVQAIHGLLARTPSRLVAVQIEDILGATEQPNLPGTVHEHPNWRRRLPMRAGALGDVDALRATAALMRDAGR